MNNNDRPKVCIIMPVFNGANTIKFALASILRQSYENWTCVIVNDGSTDETKSILDSIKDTRFHIYHLDRNRGRGYARDVALNHSEGKYLTYLDADDMMHKDKIKQQIDYLEKYNDIWMVGCGYTTFDNNYNALRSNKLSDFQSISNMKYGQALPLLPATIMLRLEYAKKICYNKELDIGEDYDYLARYCEGHRFANIGKAYYYYRTGNVTPYKLIHYQFNALKGVVVTWKMGLRVTAFTWFIRRCLKIMAYFILIPIIGTKRIINRRKGESITPELLLEYNNEFEFINKLSNI